MIVELTAEAESDLEAIGDTIAADNPRRALSFVLELRETCFDLGDLPERCPLVPRFESKGVRRRVQGRYLIFYSVGTKKVVVIHVLPGAMDYEPILFPD
ncbi:type II toxin-antitoxin system RelE/ParE family toxin [Phenylobacterium sp.]|uniref:type II toxin-antitoxin system RelE/ParE family toxin n=1 Tax=Phenylobacterium sp. TaxID=1871053 RepID=UPI0025D9BF90|nr:type II toxin-antitoxin system RelE/ParE family toxin [Phenylobacterium sp.]